MLFILHIMALVIKELQIIWRDKKSRTILILPPMLQLIIFSYAATLDVTHMNLAIFNQDDGKAAYEITQRISGSPFVKKTYYVDNYEELRDLIDSQKIIVGIVINESFSRHIESGHPANLYTILDGRRSNAAQIVEGYLSNIIEQYNFDINPQKRFKLFNRVIQKYWYNPNLNYRWFTVPSLIAILLSIVGLLVTGLAIAREREMGTFDQLLVSPLNPLEILLGKTIPALFIGLFEGTAILLIAIWVFKIPFLGSYFLFYLSMFIYLNAVIAIGLFISSLVSTQQQAILATFIFMVPAVLLSGYATPIENMPNWLQTISYADPLRFFMVIIKGLFLKAMPAEVVLHNCIPLFFIAILSYLFAMSLFRKKLG